VYFPYQLSEFDDVLQYLDFLIINIDLYYAHIFKNKFMKKYFNYLIIFLLSIIWISLMTYVPVDYYYIPESGKFNGSNFYNAYEGINEKMLLKANFHAHTKKWGGITFGDISEEELYKLYQGLGYDIIGISDYMHINRRFKDSIGFIPIYEHGINLKKTHQLVLGAREVSWSEQPYYQGFHQKQSNLNYIGKNGDLIALAHPGLTGGYKMNELRKLAGFELVEVLNQGKRYDRHWDEILSSGYPAFAIGNDDFHLMRESDYARNLNVIFAESGQQHDILDALRYGNNMVVRLPYYDSINFETKKTFIKELPKLINFDVRNDTLHVEFDKKVQSFRFIRQKGEMVECASNLSSKAYGIKASDQYIRVVAVFEDGIEILLNPVYRYHNEPFNKREALVNPGKTIMVRFITLFLLTIPFLFLVLRHSGIIKRLTTQKWEKALSTSQPK
jgi:hypothetical protein